MCDQLQDESRLPPSPNDSPKGRKANTAPCRLLPAFFIKILQLSLFWKPEMLVQRACETPCLTCAELYFALWLLLGKVSLCPLPVPALPSIVILFLPPATQSQLSPAQFTVFKIASLERWKTEREWSCFFSPFAFCHFSELNQHSTESDAPRACAN